MVKEDFVDDATPLHMSFMFYDELHELRKLKSRVFILGDIGTYRDCLEEIFSSISFRLQFSEIKMIENQFAKVENLFLQEDIFSSVDVANVKRSLRDIDMVLIKKMWKYKMIFPKFEGGGLKSLGRRYGYD